MQRFLLFITILLLSFSGCYDNHSIPSETDLSLKANFDIAELQTFCSDGCHTITRDFICVGRVTSSDREGQFYRTLFIEDESGGAAIKLGLYDIASRYPVGTQIALHLQNSAVMLKDGVVVVGLPPRSYDSEPREFESPEVIDRYIIRGTSVEAIEPRICHIAELDSSLCGRFVKISGISYAPLTDEEDMPTIEGYRRFVNSNGEAIFTYVSPYADFAAEKIPTEEISVCGILYYETVGMDIGKQFVIKARFSDDFTIADSSSL